MSDDKPTALVTAPFRGPAMDRLRELATVVYDPWIEHRPLKILGAEDLAARVQEVGATILICEADSCKGPVFDQALTVIGSTRGDPTNVDLLGATAKGIPVIHAPGRNADAVAELTIAHLFAVTRHLVPADRDVRAGDIYKDGVIPYQRFRGWELAGRTLGIVGFGAIGRAVAWRARGLGMEVLAYDPYADDAPDDLDTVLGESDAVTLHTPTTPETEGMIGKDEFARMREGAVFLNLARAALHDMDALVEALESGRLAGAGLDHFPNEYLDPEHPLCGIDNVVLTPHVGGATYNVEENQARMLTEDVEAILDGRRPARIANPEVLDR